MSTIQDDLQSRCCGSLGCQQLQDQALERIEALTSALEAIKEYADQDEVQLIWEVARDALSDQPALSPTPDPIEWNLRDAILGPGGEDDPYDGRFGWLVALVVDLRDKIQSDAEFRQKWEYDDPGAAWEALQETELLIDHVRIAIREASNARAGGGG